MIVCAAGDIHGAIDRLYQEVLAFEESLGARFAWVLHVGDFGIWPDPTRIDGATKRHDGAGDFPIWWSERREAPRKTLFIKGNHEDFVWLDGQPGPEVLPGLFYLRNGTRFNIDDGDETLTIGGLGGCFGPSDYERRSRDLQGYRKRHYTRDEIDALISGARVDVLLVHDAPTGVVFERHRRGAGWASESEGLDDLVRGVRPQVCLFGHHHTRLDTEIDGVPCLGINKAPHPGSLVAIDQARWNSVAQPNPELVYRVYYPRRAQIGMSRTRAPQATHKTPAGEEAIHSRASVTPLRGAFGAAPPRWKMVTDRGVNVNVGV